MTGLFRETSFCGNKNLKNVRRNDKVMWFLHSVRQLACAAQWTSARAQRHEVNWRSCLKNLEFGSTGSMEFGRFYSYASSQFGDFMRLIRFCKVLGQPDS